MWKWNNGLNAQVNINKNIVENFKKYAKISGILFIVLGLGGIIFPAIMSLSTLFFVSYLMIFTGLFSGWLTWKSNKEDWAGWLKSCVLFLIGVLMIYNPASGIASLGLLFAIYFFMDAFASFGLAYSTKPDKVWLIWLFNAITSLALAVIFIIGWPLNSIYLVGLFIGISLLFDGIALLTGAFTINKANDNK